MKLFSRFNDSDFEPAFIEYAKSFRSYLISEFDVEETNLLDMIYSESVKESMDIESFLDSQDENLNRTMLYALLHEFDIEVGLGTRGSGERVLCRLFAGENDYIYKDHENISDVINEAGLSGLMHSLAVRNSVIKHEMTCLNYSDVQSYEPFLSDRYGWSDNALIYLNASARNTIFFKKEFDVNVINDDGLYIPEELAALSSPDFYRLSESVQESYLSKALDRLDEIECDAQEESENPDPIDLIKLAAEWPAEYGRACLIKGMHAGDVVPMVSQLSSTLLKRAGFPQSYRDRISDIIVKRMLFSFPEEFKAFFPELPPLEDCMSKNVFVEPGSKLINDLLSKTVKLDLSWNSGIMGYSHKIVSIARENGYKVEDVLPHIKMSDNPSTLNMSCLIKNMDEIGKPAVVYIISKWLDALAAQDKTLSTPTLSATTSSISTLEDKVLFEKFNERLLLLAIKHMDSNYATEKVTQGAYFLFKDDDHKKAFIHEVVNSEHGVTPAIIELGRFSQKDFAEYWGLLSSRSKRSFIGNDLSL
jgi:hypothetical protein